MNTQATTSYVLRRVAVRAGLGLWRQRTGVLLAAVASLGIGAYLFVTGPSGLMPALAQGAAVGGGSDCADTAMAAIADKSPSAAQRAYQCMAPAFRQRVPEQAFVQQIQAQALPNVTHIDRVGQYQGASDTIVYYAVDGSNGSVGYMVYLGSDGKVLKIE